MKLIWSATMYPIYANYAKLVFKQNSHNLANKVIKPIFPLSGNKQLQIGYARDSIPMICKLVLQLCKAHILSTTQ